MTTNDDALRGVASRLAPDLRGHGVVLTPVRVEDADELAAAAASCPSDAFRWTFVDRETAGMRATIEGYPATGRYIYVVRVDGHVLGMTGYYDLEFWNERDAPDAVEIGHTWYVPEVRGTTVNPACKWLLLSHAFETWGCARVALRTDVRNAASRAAMLKLGLTFEGIRRRHMPGADGTLRDSAYFSAVADEWPAIKHGLEARLT
ncbi:MAG: N-acetyltransferase [Actinomycetota bacterium]|jgi:RimJ/RimL family protein N-acetyltransferase